MKNIFDLQDKIALVTGAGGLLGPQHTRALVEQGAMVFMSDHHYDKVKEKSEEINKEHGQCTFPLEIDVTDSSSIKRGLEGILKFFDMNKIDILVNNAAKDPKVKKDEEGLQDSRLETMTVDSFKEGYDAAINGTFLCSQIIGNQMIKQGHGVIVNIASDLAVISPDQRIYKKEGDTEETQNVKPIFYSTCKWAIVGMTKYMATYPTFLKNNIRVNCLSPTGVFNNHPENFVEKLSNIIPMGRMAKLDEYQGAIQFLCSDASSYMNGHNLVVDGGKTVW